MSLPSRSPADFLRDRLRPLVRRPVFDFWARELGTIESRDRVFARIVSKRAEGTRAVTLELEPNRNFQGFRPGQHVNLTVEIDGRRTTRSYSLTGIPCEEGRLSLTVQRVEGGIVSGHLFAEAKAGDVLELGPAFGEMTLPETPSEPLLLLAAGSGITPLVSLVRDLADRGMPVEATLIYWVRNRADLCFADELKALAAREPKFRFHPAITGDAVTALGELRGRPTASMLADVVPDLAQRSAYACGPADFVSAVEALCSPIASRFVSESFTPPILAPVAGEASVRVTLERSGRVLTVPAGVPLLDALEGQGVRPASGCRMGICNTCACGKTRGATRDLKSGAASDDADPNLRLCVSSAQSDLALDL